MLIRTFFRLFILLIINVSAYADDMANDDILSLSLEQLLHTKVVSSNGIEESLIDAPAAMLVISQSQIIQRGYNNLTEILVDLPGFDVVNNGASVSSVAYQRGYRTPFTTRTLFMIDGRVEIICGVSK